MADEYIKKQDAVMTAMDYGGNGNAQDASQDIASALIAIPAADVAPVRHGRWIEEFDGFILSYTCSECGEYALTKEETMHDAVCSNFCPNCGADMREVDNED